EVLLCVGARAKLPLFYPKISNFARQKRRISMSPTICIIEDNFGGTHELIAGMCQCLPEKGRDYSFACIWLQNNTTKNTDTFDAIEKRELEKYGKNSGAACLATIPKFIKITVDKDTHPYPDGTYNEKKFKCLTRDILEKINALNPSFLLIDLCLLTNGDSKIMSPEDGKAVDTVSMFLRKEYDGKAEVFTQNDRQDFTQRFIRAYRRKNAFPNDKKGPSVFLRTQLAGRSWDKAHCTQLGQRITESIGKQNGQEGRQE
ncbi:hypothetical protein LJC46_02900, partial [Desulfovibrio sp. OttesenSCG-928-G15]|nr:hypothetical protein [Desulfovibrio sp. OttesenSCG-928-G15]